MAKPNDLICFSHLRWNFVFQRPQHLLTRFARERRVFFLEEPIYDARAPYLEFTPDPSGVTVTVPHLVAGTDGPGVRDVQRKLLDDLVRLYRIEHPVAWYYTPMARTFSSHLAVAATVYDCMDELSAFAGAPPGLLAAEQDLLRAADVVFTGGQTLFEAKRHLHPNIHAFPSSVDVPHFARARTASGEPSDQAALPRPRAGFFGVLDERFDVPLLAAAAALRPDWHFVLVGPVVKIDPATLPRAANIHYLGPKTYTELPDYIGGWDVALLPFARNEATRFISPTKTPEYLAAGRPVVSTSIRDVVHPYGDLNLVHIADEPAEFVRAMDAALAAPEAARRAAADAFLASMSWDATWQAMAALVDAVVKEAEATRSPATMFTPQQPVDAATAPASA